MILQTAEYFGGDALRMVIDGNEVFYQEPKGPIHLGYVYLTGAFEDNLPETVCSNGYRSNSLTSDPVIVCLAFRFVRDLRKGLLPTGPVQIPTREQALSEIRPTLAEYLRSVGDPID